VTPRSCFAVVAPGLDAVAVAELRTLGFADAAVEDGGVAFVTDDAGLMRANLHVRVASRLLVRLASFPATSFAELERKAKTVPWATVQSPDRPVAFRVTCRKSRLYHSDAVAERLEKSVVRAVPGVAVAKAAADDDVPVTAQGYVVRVFRDVVTISADASGPLLHRRGYRLDTAKAPMRETLAAACLLALGYDGTAPLLDPMCGSGTIPIEGALIAAGIAPGAYRAFACEAWPSMDAGAVRRERGAVARAPGPARAAILASDRDAGAADATRANAERAGVADRIAIAQRAFSALEAPPGPGLLLTNPPYGARVKGGPDLRNLYAQFGNVARRSLTGWRVALVSADRALEQQARLPFEDVLEFSNGGIAVRLVAATVA
jgi:putative N6-adenine-specific DNA methylase